ESASFRQTVICVALQTAWIGLAGKLVWLRRLIIGLLSLNIELGGCKPKLTTALNVLHRHGASHNPRTKQHKFSQPSFAPFALRSLTHANFHSPEGGFARCTSPALTLLPSVQTDPALANDSDHEHYIPLNLTSEAAGVLGDGSYQELLLAASAASVDEVTKSRRRRRLTHAGEPCVEADYLHMRGWRVTSIEYKRDETVVHADLLTELTHCRCKKCDGGCRSTKIIGHGLTRTQYLQHTPSDERPRRIAYHRQRYFCLGCEHTSGQPIPGIYKGTKMTRQLRRYIARQSLVEPFDRIAKRVGRSEKDIRKVFVKHSAHLKKIREIETPRVMGMDGVYVNRRESLIVTDLERRRPVLMHPSINERPMAAALRKMSDLDKVEEVVADMAGGLERVQKAVMPKARRTKDRYHVQRMANAAVDVVRRALTPGKKERKKGQMAMCSSHILRKRKNKLIPAERADRDWCLGFYPELRLTYDLKEAYCEIWRSINGTIARRKYAEWLELHKAWRKEMPKDLREAFHPLLWAMKNWEEGIFNYFDGRHTNAYTESANAQVKEIARKAPRARFDTIEAKVIQGRRLQQQREGVREWGKAQRRAQRRQHAQGAQELTLSTPVDDLVSTVQVPQASNASESPLILSPMMMDVKKQGTRLEVDRIGAFKTTPKRERRNAMPSSLQMPLFE
ncbi:MAG: transposase, partial [Pyrinomonadaceae bacterium]